MIAVLLTLALSHEIPCDTIQITDQTHRHIYPNSENWRTEETEILIDGVQVWGQITRRGKTIQVGNQIYRPRRAYRLRAIPRTIWHNYVFE